MPDSAILVVAAVVGTTVLLALGLGAGFWAGFQAAACREAGELAELKLANKSKESQLSALTSAIQTGHEQSEVVGMLAHSSHDALPLEFSTAIDRMLTTMRALERKLQELELAQGTAVTVAQQSHSKVSAERVTRPPMHSLRVRDESQMWDPGLTNQEMRDVIGSRHCLIEATNEELASKRYTYDCQQHMAPWAEGEPLPESTSYVSVQCREISVTGISFLWEEIPTFARAVISIGPPHAEIYMVVQVLRYRAVYMHESVCNLVECEFVSRLERATEVFSARESAVCP